MVSLKDPLSEQLFSIHIGPLRDTIRELGVANHRYTDDMVLYTLGVWLKCNGWPWLGKDSTERLLYQDVRRRLLISSLQLNSEKTEYLCIIFSSSFGHLRPADQSSEWHHGGSKPRDQVTAWLHCMMVIFPWRSRSLKQWGPATAI